MGNGFGFQCYFIPRHSLLDTRHSYPPQAIGLTTWGLHGSGDHRLETTTVYRTAVAQVGKAKFLFIPCLLSHRSTVLAKASDEPIYGPNEEVAYVIP